ncbi:LacI family DNA-binding transcriptional regulator [Butyrivibrio proteoclasticus]|uniref:LacI family DNA-binding transcriptional regulator n=1 Tax=Butyrivibrio proteoclasticus TaxID=43305 RepID=UPI00047D5158|nr:LacI family DNA-binding transcriptional regulator [Butyrivibrio proteoclasticus]
MSNIREVAKAAGVSTATVSRVINHDTEGRMTEETKERVWAAIAELNYKAPAKNIKKKSKSLRQQSEGTHFKIGCIISTDKDKYSDPYYLSILASIESEAARNGYTVPFIATSKEIEECKALDSFFPALDGIILMNTLSPDIYSYIKRNIPAIVGIDTSHRDIDNIIYDHYEAASLAVSTLAERGYKDIGFLGASPQDSTLEDSKRFRGFLGEMNSRGLTVKKETCINCHWNEDECYAGIKKLHKKKALPRAFVVSSDLMAMAVLRSLYDFNIKVPEEVAVMGITNIEMARFSNPPLSTISVPMTEMGMVAVDALKERMNGYKMLPRKISLPLEVILRSSI